MVLFGERGNGLHSLLSFRRRESLKRIEQSDNLGLQRDCAELRRSLVPKIHGLSRIPSMLAELVS